MSNDNPRDEQLAIIDMEEELNATLEMKIRSFRDAHRFYMFSRGPGIVISNRSVPVFIPDVSRSSGFDSFVHDQWRGIIFSALHGQSIGCVKCLMELFSQWRGETDRIRSMPDLVRDSDQLGKSRKAFSSNHIKWRKNFLMERGSACEICGDADTLELAHITSVEDFFYRYHKGRKLRYPSLKYLGVERSYRKDNLMILCTKCHDAQTMSWDILYALMRPAEFIDLLHRKHQVLDRFSSVMDRRGWQTAEDLYQSKLI